VGCGSLVSKSSNGCRSRWPSHGGVGARQFCRGRLVWTRTRTSHAAVTMSCQRVHKTLRASLVVGGKLQTCYNVGCGPSSRLQTRGFTLVIDSALSRCHRQSSAFSCSPEKLFEHFDIHAELSRSGASGLRTACAHPAREVANERVGTKRAAAPRPPVDQFQATDSLGQASFFLAPHAQKSRFPELCQPPSVYETLLPQFCA
jgi:hypothetical protein